MKSRDEIVIIMLQWLRLYTLGSRGSRELKTFLETRLISSRVDQKLKNKEGKYMLLKREIGPKSWVIETIVEAVLHGRESASLGRTRSSHVGRKFRFVFAPNSRLFGHDRATIGPRSWSWPSVDRPLIGWQRLLHVNPPIAVRSRCDRGLIGPRSWSSSTIGLRRPMTLQVRGWPRLRDQVETGFEERPPSDVDLNVIHFCEERSPSDEI